ncbi:MAG: SDR family NAD(P)-dependent oxidoreductase [Caldilineaceae bacterium]
MQNLSGKTALITGSGRGIGRGIALALAARGCNVAVNYMRKREAAEETAAAVEAAGGRAIVVKANVANEEEIHRLVEETVSAFGGVDIFVANAASGVLRPVMEIERRHWIGDGRQRAQRADRRAGNCPLHETGRVGTHPEHHQHRQPSCVARIQRRRREQGCH